MTSLSSISGEETGEPGVSPSCLLNAIIIPPGLQVEFPLNPSLAPAGDAGGHGGPDGQRLLSF